jgi:DNA-binding MarR family transcriptional regulator
MARSSQSLGTLVRRLLELLDGEVEASYLASGLNWRPRYTPIVRALMQSGPAPIKAVAIRIGISHSAVSQTVSQMSKDGLVTLAPGRDGRERIIALTGRTEKMIPVLERQWAATNAAADQLDAELTTPLTSTLTEAIAALERRSFGERIACAARSKSS